MAEPEIITEGTLRTSDGERLPLQQTAVTATIDGAVARVVVRQTFTNARANAIEAIYSFPLPHDASVWRMEFHIRDRVVKGVIKERAAARRAYDVAKSEGRAVTLLEEDAPAVFTLSIANVPAGEQIEVHLEYQEILRYDAGRFVFVFPMVAPDLYRDGPLPSAANAMPPPRMPSPDRASDVAIEVRIPRGVLLAPSIRCRSHDVHPGIERGAAVVRLGGAGPIPNRDFVLEWPAADAGVRPSVRAERGTFLLTLAPPRADADVEIRSMGSEARPVRCGNCGALITDSTAFREIAGFGPLVMCRHCGAMLAPAHDRVVRATRGRDVAIVLDRSASMKNGMVQARALASAVMDALPPGDAIAAMTFDHDRAIFDGNLRWVTAAPEVARRIDTFFDVPARGGSDMTRALEEVAKLPARAGRTRVIVLITDGAVGNTAKLVRGVPELFGRETSLFVIGVGAAVNRHFVATLARAGRGASEVVVPGQNFDSVRKSIGSKIVEGGPVVVDLALSWDGAAPSAMHPSPLPDLYGTEPLRILGRYTGHGPSKLVITGSTAAGQPFRQELDVDLPAADAADATVDELGLERLWARREVTALIDADKKTEALALALRHSLATPLTSLIAEDSEVSVQKTRIPKARLVVKHGEQRGQVFELGAATARIGRSPQATIMLRDPNVSRIHFEILIDASGYRLRDHSSTNGTLVDGVVVREKKLAEDAVIQLGGKGGVELAFSLSNDEWLAILPTETVNVHDAEAEERVEARAMIPLRAPAAPAGFGGARPMAGSGGPPPPMSAPAPARPAYFAPPPPPPGGYGAPPRPAAGMPAPSFAKADDHDTEPPASMSRFPPGEGRARRSVPFVAAAGGPPPMFGRPSTAGPLTPAAAPRKTSTMSGRIAEVPLADLLQLLEAARKDGQLVLRRADGEPGRIFLRAGRVVDASFDRREAPWDQALLEMHRWTDATFDLEPMTYERSPSHGGSLPQAPAILPSGPGYPEAELVRLRHRLRGELDLALVVDETQSMAPYIATVRERMTELCHALAKSPLCKSLRVAIIGYRDHPPQDGTFASRVALPFSSDIEQVGHAVNTLKALGGGDGPESVTDGLVELVRLDWRPEAARVAVWFGDAPPHGVEPSGDGFPDGCPCGHDWFAQAESCREMGIPIYAIGCLPQLRKYSAAEQVYRTIARATRGMYLALHEASLLTSLIGGAAEAALDTERVDTHVLDLVQEHAPALAATDEAERARWILNGLRRAGVEPRALEDEKAIFRLMAIADVEASLARLRAQDRVAW